MRLVINSTLELIGTSKGSNISKKNYYNNIMKYLKDFGLNPDYHSGKLQASNPILHKLIINIKTTFPMNKNGNLYKEIQQGLNKACKYSKKILNIFN